LWGLRFCFKELRKEENQKTSELNRDDFEEIASALISIIDYGLIFLAKTYAKDDTDAPYSIRNEKKDKLIYQLTLVLVKYQIRWKIEFLFLATLVIVYTSSFKKAYSRRKLVKEIERLEKSNDQRARRKADELKRTLKKSRGGANKV